MYTVGNQDAGGSSSGSIRRNLLLSSSDEVDNREDSHGKESEARDQDFTRDTQNATARYHAFTSHHCKGTYCSQPYGPVTPSQNLEQAASRIEEILSRFVLCRHDIDEINGLYDFMDSLEKNFSVNPECSTLSIVKKICEIVDSIFKSSEPTSADLINLHHLSLSHPLRGYQGFTSNLAEKKILKLSESSSSNSEDRPDLLLNIADNLPYCVSEAAFDEDILALIGKEHQPAAQEILEEKKKALRADSQLQEKIQERKDRLSSNRLENPEKYPLYFDELLEHGLIHLYDHILEMQKCENSKGLIVPDAITEKVQKMSLSQIAHVVLEIRSVIVDKVSTLLSEDCSSIVLVIGETGVGKSTTFRLLMGDEMEHPLGEDNAYESKDHKGFISHSGIHSCTLIPNVGVFDGMAIVDCPGFDDTRGPLINMGLELAIRALIRRWSIKILIVTQLSGASKGTSFSKLRERLTRLLGKDSKGKCCIGITQYRQDPDFKSKRKATKKLEKESSLHFKTMLKNSEKKIQEKERIIFSQCGIDYGEENLMRLDLLENKDLPHHCRQILSRMKPISSAEEKRALDSDCMEKFIMHGKNKKLKALVESLRNRPEGIDQVERKVLESSLIEALFSSLHPEIVAFLSLPEMDPRVALEFDQQILNDWTKTLIDHFKNHRSLLTTGGLVRKIVQEFQNEITKEGLDKLQSSWDRLTGMLEAFSPGIGNQNLQSGDEENVSEAWRILKETHEIELDFAKKQKSEELALPSWVKWISPPIPILNAHSLWERYIIGPSLKKLDNTKARRIYSKVASDIDVLHQRLIRLNHLKHVTTKRQELYATCTSSEVHLESFSDFKGHLTKKFETIQSTYGDEAWNERIDQLNKVLTSRDFLWTDTGYLEFFMILALESTPKEVLKEKLVTNLAEEGLAEEVILTSLLEEDQQGEMRVIFTGALKEALEAASLCERALSAAERDVIKRAITPLLCTGEIVLELSPILMREARSLVELGGLTRECVSLAAELRQAAMQGIANEELVLEANNLASYLISESWKSAGRTAVTGLKVVVAGAITFGALTSALGIGAGLWARRNRLSKETEPLEPDNEAIQKPTGVSNLAQLLVNVSTHRNEFAANLLNLDLNNPLSRVLLQAVLIKNCKLFSSLKDDVEPQAVKDKKENVLEILMEKHPEIAVCLIVCSKLKTQKEEIRSAFDQQINELPLEIINSLKIQYGEDLYNQLDEIASAIESTQKRTGKTQESNAIPHLPTIPNNGSGLRCGYYAMAAGILQLCQADQDRIFRQIEFNQDQLKEDIINQDQYVLGNHLYEYSINHSEIFQGRTNNFIDTLRDAFTNQQNIPEAGIDGCYDSEHLERTIVEVQETVRANIDIFADRIQILANHLEINCKINNQIYAGNELENAPEICISNPRGGHYECIVKE